MFKTHCSTVLQVVDVQSGVWYTSAHTSGSRRGDGSGLVVGTTCIKDAMRPLERWLAATYVPCT